MPSCQLRHRRDPRLHPHSDTLLIPFEFWLPTAGFPHLSGCPRHLEPPQVNQLWDALLSAPFVGTFLDPLSLQHSTSLYGYHSSILLGPWRPHFDKNFLKISVLASVRLGWGGGKSKRGFGICSSWNFLSWNQPTQSSWAMWMPAVISHDGGWWISSQSLTKSWASPLSPSFREPWSLRQMGCKITFQFGI